MGLCFGDLVIAVCPGLHLILLMRVLSQGFMDRTSICAIMLSSIFAGISANLISFYTEHQCILSHLFRVPSLLDQSLLFVDKFFYYHFPLFEAFYVVPDENLVILRFAVVSSFSKTVLILSLTVGLLKVAVLYISSPLLSIQRNICLTFLASSVSYSGLFKISSHFYLNCLNIL